MGCSSSCSKLAAAADPVRNDEKVALKQPGAKVKPASAEVISKKVAQAKQTRVLALRECGLKQLPATATAADLAQLKTADLTSNSLKTLPDSIGVWSSLKNLQCAQNLLTAVPDSIGQLVTVETINLSENTIKILPSALSQCGKLQTLNLEGNKLGPQLPDGIFGGALASVLKELLLSRNALESLPASIAQLSSLERLVVAENRLVALPVELGSIGKLQHLDAAENEITALPDGFLVELTSLSELWLKGNPMERLVLQKAPGFEAFLERRKKRLDAKIEANVVGRVDLTVCGLE